MKCAPQAGLTSVRGTVLHDSHAEVLVIRAFNRLLLDQCLQLAKSHDKVSASADLLITRNAMAQDGRSCVAPFSIRDGLKIHMYCSECPCGDASMELVMSRQADPTPWPMMEATSDNLLGRGHFGQLGIVRRKPSRPDAPPTHSKSCSDKLALRQCTSLLSGMTALYISPENAFLRNLVMHIDEIIPDAITRAFGSEGRLKGLAKLEAASTITFHPFSVLPTERAFDFRRTPDEPLETLPKPSDRACVHFMSTTEVIINGVLSGFKRSDPRAASAVSRRRLWEQALRVSDALASPTLTTALCQSTYEEVKNSHLLKFRTDCKHAVTSTNLSPWASTTVDKDWGL